MTASVDWWATFFEGPALEAWRELVRPEWTASDVAFLEQQFQPAAGSRLLDVPCGNGRHAIELARRGYRVTGVDLSQEFIDEARGRSRELGIALELHVRDMRQLDFATAFDGAYCFGNSFGYLNDDGNREFIRRIATALRPGAGFALHTGVAAESVLPNLADNQWHQAGSTYLLMESSYDPLRSRLNTDYTFLLRDGIRVSRTASYRVYTLRQLCDMLREAGFDAIEAFSDREGTEFGAGSPELFLLARRASG